MAQNLHSSPIYGEDLTSAHIPTSAYIPTFAYIPTPACNPASVYLGHQFQLQSNLVNTLEHENLLESTVDDEYILDREEIMKKRKDLAQKPNYRCRKL